MEQQLAEHCRRIMLVWFYCFLLFIRSVNKLSLVLFKLQYSFFLLESKLIFLFQPAKVLLFSVMHSNLSGTADVVRLKAVVPLINEEIRTTSDPAKLSHALHNLYEVDIYCIIWTKVTLERRKPTSCHFNFIQINFMARDSNVFFLPICMCRIENNNEAVHYAINSCGT